MKSTQQFQTQAKEKNITSWPILTCSMCGYECAYIFKNNEVFYDSGCNCTGGSYLEPRTWKEVAETYNMQDSPRVIAEMDQYWQFS